MLTQGQEGEVFLSDVQIVYPGTYIQYQIVYPGTYIQYQIWKIRWHGYEEGVKAAIVLWRIDNVLQNGLQCRLMSLEKP